MEKIIINKAWKFHLGDCPDAWEKGYVSDDWKEVDVPHDWSVKLPFSKEYSSGTGYLAGGIGWYRKSFTLPEEYRGKKIWVVFDGIYKNSQVWCNSYYLGKWPYGYTTFRYEITDKVSFGDCENIIAVKVDHRDISDSRWFTGSGITRKVQIIVQDSVYIEQDGLYFKTPVVTNKEAEVSVENHVVNSTSKDVEITVESNLVTLDGTQKESFRKDCKITGESRSIIITGGEINNPRLWSVDRPELYRLITKLYVSGECIETREGKVGIRSFTFNPDKGFYLNGMPLKIKGVCVHHDAGCLGAAVLPEVWARRLRKLKNMGCNAIRTSHNPHMPELYDLCDSMGFLVMDEAFDEWEGPKNKWSTGHNVYPPKHQGYYEDFPEWHERDLRAMIKRDCNHPSIIMWSVGNEIDYPNDPYCHPLFYSMTGNNDSNKPAAEKVYNPNKPNAERLTIIIKRLIQIVKEVDITRPVTAAVAFPELSTQIGFIDNMDVVGYNYKEYLYEQDHKHFPDKPFIGSENDHSIRAWKAVKENEYISGQFLWTGIDYLGEAYGWPIHGSGAGEITLAGFEKTSYYFRKSLWSDEPIIRIFTCRLDDDYNNEFKRVYQKWNYSTGEMVQIRCYTNLSEIELFINGESYGKKARDDERGYVSCVLPYREGALEALSIDKKIIDRLETTGAPCNIKLSLWKDEKIKQWQDSIFQGNNELAQIEVIITDSHNRRVVEDSTLLQVTVSGPAILMGIENGDLADVTEYSAPYRRSYEGRMLIYVKKKDEEGEAKVIVKGDGLKQAVLIL